MPCSECLANPLNRRRASVAILAAACVAACSGDTMTGPNRAPEGTGTIGDQSLEPGESTTFDIAGYFTDPDGDRLTYTAESTHSDQATASMSGSMLTISGVAAGEPSVIVTATDPGGLFALQSTNVSVRPPNRAPVPVGSIPGVIVNAEAPSNWTQSGTSGIRTGTSWTTRRFRRTRRWRWPRLPGAWLRSRRLHRA